MIPALRRWRVKISALTGVRRMLLAMGFGVAAGTAMAPFHLVMFLIPGFVGLLWLLQSSSTKRQAFSMGWAFGVGHFAIGFYWIGHAFLVDAATYGWLAPIAVLGLACGMAIFPGCITLLSSQIIRRFDLSTVGQVLVLAVIWVAFEWVRSWLFTGFPWNLIGTVWAVSGPIMQFAAIAGVYGLGLATLIVATMPAVLAEDAYDRQSKGGLILAVVLAIVILGSGMWRLSGASDEMVTGVQLRLIQPNIPQHLKWKPGHKVGHVQNQVELSKAPPKNGIAPTHIIWAETAVPFNLTHDKNLLSFLGAAAPKGGYLVTGAPRSNKPGTPNPQYWNSLFAIDPKGKIAATYDKSHLVPFGEYVPYREILKVSKLTAGRVDFTPGSGARVWDLPGLPPVAPLICYEAIFPAEVTSLGARPDWLLNVTNDAWFGKSAGPYQHFAAVRFRAIELGIPLVRVANTGISAVVDGYGRVGTYLELGVRGVVDSPLPKRLSQTPLYGRFGDRVTLVLLLAAFVGGVFLRQQRAGPLS